MRFFALLPAAVAAAAVLPALGHHPDPLGAAPDTPAPTAAALSARSPALLARALAADLVSRAHPAASGLQRRGPGDAKNPGPPPPGSSDFKTWLRESEERARLAIQNQQKPPPLQQQYPPRVPPGTSTSAQPGQAPPPTQQPAKSDKRSRGKRGKGAKGDKGDK